MILIPKGKSRIELYCKEKKKKKKKEKNYLFEQRRTNTYPTTLV